MKQFASSAGACSPRICLLILVAAVMVAPGALSAPVTFQEGLPPALALDLKYGSDGSLVADHLRSQIEQLQALAETAKATQPRVSFWDRLTGSSNVARPVSIEDLAGYAAALRGQRVVVEGLYEKAEGANAQLRTDRARCLVSLAEGTQLEGLPANSPAFGLPVLVEGMVELRGDLPVIRGDRLRPAMGLCLLRIARAREMLGEDQEAIRLYAEAERTLAAPHDSLRAFARVSAGRVAFDSLRDKAQAQRHYNMAWTSYVTNIPPGTPALSVWMPVHNERRWQRSTVQEAIAETLDSLNSESFWYRFVAFFVALCGGSAALGVLLLALVVRVAIWPLTKKQLQSAEAMKRLQPQIKELQSRWASDKGRFQQEFWKLCQANGVNPLGGCLPLLIQMPILYMVYQGIRLYIVEFSKASFLWVPSLAGPDMVLLIAYTISMILFQKMTQKTSPQALDPQQEQQQKMMMYLMPVMFFFMFKSFPSAFILYWLATNIIYFAQQWNYTRVMSARGGVAAQGKPSSFVAAMSRLLSGEPAASDDTPGSGTGKTGTVEPPAPEASRVGKGRGERTRKSRKRS